MANTQTSVPLFVANSVLTAAQQNISAGTGVPVFSTSVTRDAAFGGSNKVLAEGQLCYLESTNVVQYYDGAAWATVGPSSAGGLVFITGASFTTAASVSLPTSTFTSTYTNYRISLNVSSAASMSALRLRFRAAGTDNTASNYQTGYTTDQAFNNQLSTSAYLSNCAFGASANLNNTQSMDIYNPQSAIAASWIAQGQYLTTSNNSQQSFASGVLTVTTAYDALTFLGDAGTMTGSYKVYGYTNS